MAESIPEERQANEQAREEAVALEKKGDAKGVFFAFLGIDHRQGDAFRIARSDPEAYLRLMGTKEIGAPDYRVALVKAGLAFQLGRKEEALVGFRDDEGGGLVLGTICRALNV